MDLFTKYYTKDTDLLHYWSQLCWQSLIQNMTDPPEYTVLRRIHLDLSEVRIPHTSYKCRMELQLLHES